MTEKIILKFLIPNSNALTENVEVEPNLSIITHIFKSRGIIHDVYPIDSRFEIVDLVEPLSENQQILLWALDSKITSLINFLIEKDADIATDSFMIYLSLTNYHDCFNLLIKKYYQGTDKYIIIMDKIIFLSAYHDSKFTLSLLTDLTMRINKAKSSDTFIEYYLPNCCNSVVNSIAQFGTINELEFVLNSKIFLKAKQSRAFVIETFYESVFMSEDIDKIKLVSEYINENKIGSKVLFIKLGTELSCVLGNEKMFDIITKTFEFFNLRSHRLPIVKKVSLKNTNFFEQLSKKNFKGPKRFILSSNVFNPLGLGLISIASISGARGIVKKLIAKDCPVNTSDITFINLLVSDEIKIEISDHLTQSFSIKLVQDQDEIMDLEEITY